jgi:hypothetical protein
MGDQWRRSSETAAKHVPSPQYIQNRPCSRAATRRPSTTSVTMAPLFDERMAYGVPAKAGPCLVHVRISEEVATKSVPTLPSKAVYRQTNPPLGDSGTPGVFAAAGPLPGLPAVVGGKDHRFRCDLEVDAVGTRGQSDTGGSAVATNRVLGAEQEMDDPAKYYGTWVEHVLRCPIDHPFAHRTGEPDVGTCRDHSTVMGGERAEPPFVAQS